MDIDAFNALIAQVRESAASLAQAEQKVAAFKTELAEQAKDAESNAAPVRSIKSISLSKQVTTAVEASGVTWTWSGLLPTAMVAITCPEQPLFTETVLLA